MELSWLYGWADFLIPMLVRRPFNVVCALVIMAIAYVLTRISFGRGWRVVWIVLLQFAGFACGSFIVLHHGFYGPYPLFDGSWIIRFFSEAKDSFTIFSIFMHIVWTVIFWWAGLDLARRPLSYAVLCRRFDVGLAAFFALFLFKLLLAVRGGAPASTFIDVSLAIAFLLSGLCAIGLARSEGGARKEYLAGGRRAGVFITFASVVVVVAGCLAVIFLSQGQLLADVGWKAFSGAGGFFGPILVNVMRFLFRNRIRESAPGQSNGSLINVSENPERIGWMDSVELVLAWFLAILCVLGVLFIVFYLAVVFFRRLSAKTGVDKKGHGGVSVYGFLNFLKRCFYVSRDCLRWIAGARGTETARSLYAMLVRWGRRSGLAHSVCETPSEFGMKLKVVFPVLSREIDLVIDGLNREAYGGMVLDHVELGALKSSLRRMVSPRWWPMRIKAFFSGRSLAGG